MKHVLTLFALFIIYNINAQTNFKSGYIIINSADTINGEIDLRNWEKNPKTIDFKKGDLVKKYTTKEIDAFEVLGECLYQKRGIEYYTNPIELPSLRSTYSTTLLKEEVFLRVLCRGTFTLFEYITNERSYFFIKKQESTSLIELIYRCKLVNKVIEFDEQYKNLLLSLATEQGKEQMKNAIYNAKYDRQSILKIVNELNNNQQEVFYKKKRLKKVDLNVSVFQNTFFSAQNIYNSLSVANAEYSSTFGGRVGIGFTFLNGNGLGRLQPRIGVSLKTLTIKAENNSGSTFSRSSFKGTTGVAEFQLATNFVLNPLSKVKIGLAPLVSYNYVLNKKAIKQTTEGPQVSTINGVPPLYDFFVFGGNLNIETKAGKMFIEYGTSSYLVIDNAYVDVKLNYNSIAIGYAYTFQKGRQ